MREFAELEVYGRINEFPAKGVSILPQVTDCLGLPDNVYKADGSWHFTTSGGSLHKITEASAATYALLDCSFQADELILGAIEAANQSYMEEADTILPASLTGELGTELDQVVAKISAKTARAANFVLARMQEAWEQQTALITAMSEFSVTGYQPGVSKRFAEATDILGALTAGEDPPALEEATEEDLETVRLDVARLLREIETEGILGLMRAVEESRKIVDDFKAMAKDAPAEGLPAKSKDTAARNLRKAAIRARVRGARVL